MDPATPPPPRRRPAWHVVYYILAAFDVLTVSASVLLTQRLFDSYNRAVAQNQEWARHVDEYAELQRLAAAVNAPGNDVFDTLDVATESARMSRARVEFAARLARVRRHLADVHPHEGSELLARFDALVGAMGQMTAEADAIFAEFAAGQPEQAARRMAAMDRKYANVLSAFHDLRSNVSRIQQRLFAEQSAAARGLQRFELLIASLIVIMVGGALVYGRRIQTEMRREMESRESYRAELEERVAKDTTRLLELRETLRREENMAAVGALVAGVAHEVRNPLFAISSTLDAFEARFGQTPGLEKYFPVLRMETDRLSRLMRDLLEYGRPPRMEATSIGLRSVIAEAVRACEADARAGGVEVAVELPGDLPNVTVDPERMAQVFQNVIHNAVLHTPRDGRVVVEAAVREAQGRRWIECAVRDGGPGFRSADLPHDVFRPLFTRRPGGTGLGLAIAHRIVEMHGGQMSASNRPQGGAVVTVRLPLEPVHREEVKALA